MNSVIAQDTIETNCIFYIGGENNLDCFNKGNFDYKKMCTTDNGFFNDLNGYCPKKKGFSHINYNGKIYRTRVLELPNPEMYLEAHKNSNDVAAGFLLAERAIIPILKGVGVNAYITMTSIIVSLSDNNGNEIVTLDLEKNLFSFKKKDIKKASYFVIKSATVHMANDSEEGYGDRIINCNLKYTIIH